MVSHESCSKFMTLWLILVLGGLAAATGRTSTEPTSLFDSWATDLVR